MSDDLTKLTLRETLDILGSNKISLDELNKAYFARIKQYNPILNAYLYINEQNKKIPAAVKDVFVTKDMPSTGGSKILERFIPPYDATVVLKLAEKGIGVIGKTNCDEFAMGGSGENSAYGATKNPWDLTKVPGGSSSGSAVAVAADLCTFAIGSDTGGSIRQPASLCGVVGLKTSYGRVSRYGLMAMASSLDTVGHFTKSVEDAAIVLDWISGGDGYDSNCTGDKLQVTSDKLKRGIKGLKVGVPEEYFGEGLDPKVEKVVKDAIKKLEELGAEIVEISLPHSKYALAAYYIIVPSEVSSNMARFDGIRYGSNRSNFGQEVKRRIMLGTFALSTGYYDEYFAKAAKVRTLIKQDFDKAYEKCDVIVGPVSPTAAWNIGEKIDDPLKMYLADIYTISANLAGLCGLSVPCGFTDGLPVGLQILGKQFDEETILKAGYCYEQSTNWRKEKPKL